MVITGGILGVALVLSIAYAALSHVIRGLSDKKVEVQKNYAAKEYFVNLEVEQRIPRRITVAITTNFPDNTNLHVRVSRTFLEKGSRLQYAGDMFAEDAAVDSGKINLEVPIDDSRWIAERNGTKEKFQNLGIWAEIDTISPDVSVTVLYSSMRTQPATVREILGPKGENFDGPNAKRGSGYTYYSVSRTICIPMAK